MTKKSYLSSIFLVTEYYINFIGSKRITSKKLFFKKHKLSQKIRKTYIAFLYQPKALPNYF